MSRPDTRTAMVWLEPEQVAAIGPALVAAGLRVIEAGSSSTGRGPEVAKALSELAVGMGADCGDANGDVRSLGDLRSAITTTAASVIVLAAPGDFGDDHSGGGTSGGGVGGGGSGVSGGDADDAAVLRSARLRGITVVSVEPIPSSVLQLGGQRSRGVPAGGGVVGVVGGEGIANEADDQDAGVLLGHVPEVQTARASGGVGGVTGGGEWASFLPSMRHCRAMREAADVLAQLGPLRSAVVQCWGGPAHGSLGARVYDAMHLIVWLLGMPEQVDAAYVWPSSGRAGVGTVGGGSVHYAPTQSLRGLHGDLTANLRFPDGRAAVMAASDRAGRWERSVSLIGEHGRLRLSDESFVWIDRAGKVVDIFNARELPPRPAGEHGESASGGVEGSTGWSAMGDQLARSLDPALPALPPVDVARVLGVTGAALLSARTGEAESPATILRMAHAG